MELIIKKQIGKNQYTFIFEGKNLYEVITESQKLSFDDVPRCGKCSSDNLILSSHQAQGKFKYTEIRCLDCRSSLTFGQKQEDPDTFYLRRNNNKELDWKAYNLKGDNDTTSNSGDKPAINGVAKTVNQPSGPAVSITALKYVNEIITTTNDKEFENLGGRIKNDSTLTKANKEYLRVLYRKKLNQLNPQQV